MIVTRSLTKRIGTCVKIRSIKVEREEIYLVCIVHGLKKIDGDDHYFSQFGLCNIVGLH